MPQCAGMTPDLAACRYGEDDNGAEGRSVKLDAIAARNTDADVGGAAATSRRLATPSDGLARRETNLRRRAGAVVEAHQLRAAELAAANQHRSLVVREHKPHDFLPRGR